MFLERPDCSHQLNHILQPFQQMNSICKRSYAFQIHPQSPVFQGYISHISRTINLTSCGCMDKASCSYLVVLLQAWCQQSKLSHLKKQQLQVDISLKEEKRQSQELKKCPKSRSIKKHFNTAEDHHRQLYEKSLLYYLYGHKIHRLSKKAYQFPRLYDTLRKQCYFKCCINFCKESLCCELVILKGLKSLLGGSIDIPPLRNRVVTHFTHYRELKDPLINLEKIVSIGSISKDLDDLSKHFCCASSQQPQLSDIPPNFLANLPEISEIDPEYLVEFLREEDESEDDKSGYWPGHLQSGFREMSRIKEGNKVYLIIDTNDMYEEMQEEYDQMYN